MNSRHRTSSPASPAAPLDDDDLLREILLRLPPQPSSLPRASLVCTRWHDFVADAGFLRLFRVHHRKAPPLGFLTREHGQVVFTPTLDPPDRIPAARFSWTPPPPPKIQVDCRYCQGEGWCFFGCHELQRERWSFPGCHHGLALLLNWQKREAIVWDPVTVPRNSAVVCAASDGGHVHGACHLSPFKFVLVCNDIDCKHAFVCLYESGSAAWGNIIEAAATTIDPCRPSVLVGDALCWLLRGGRILKFDHERQSLAVIDRPADAQVASYHDSDFDCFQILRIEDSVLGLAILFELSIHIWEIKSDCGGVVKWMLRKTIQLGELLCVEKGPVTILGYDEVTNMILLSSDSGDFMVQLESMWFKNISRREYKKELTYHPYSNFYTAVRLREQQKDQSESRKGPELSKGKKIADGKAECTMPDENTAQTTKPRNKVQTEAQSEKTTKVRSGSKRSSTTPIYIGTNQNASTSQQEANSSKKKKQVQSIKGNVSDNFEA